MAVAGIDGLISGLPTADIIDSMIAADRQATVQLEGKRDLFSLRQEAVQTLNLRLLDADIELSKLKRSSTFEAKSVSSSNDSVLTGTAFSRAAAGSYQMEVTQLAQAHQVVTANGAAIKDSPNFQGTMSITVGETTTEVELTDLSSLQDVASALNGSDAGVTATIVNDGSEGSPNYRLMIQAEETGADNTISVAVTDTDGIANSGFDALFDTTLDRSGGVVSNNFTTDKDSLLYAGDLDIKINGASNAVAISGLQSLDQVASTINTAAIGVTASVVNDGDGSNPRYRLQLDPDTPGDSLEVEFTDSDGTDGSGFDALFASTQQLKQAADTSIDLTVGVVGSGNEFTVTKTSSNMQVTDIVDGLSVTAHSVGSADLTIGFDTEPAKNAITTFVDSLNSALEYHAANAQYDVGADEAGILFSESDIRFALNALKQTFIEGSIDGDGSIKTLAALGITLNENNGLFELDEDTLGQMLSADPQGVSDFFVADGLGSRLDDKFSALTESVDGLMATKQDTLTTQIDALNDRITEMDARLEMRRQRYEAQFLNMEKLMAQFQTQEQFMAGQIEAFANMAARSSGRQ